METIEDIKITNYREYLLGVINEAINNDVFSGRNYKNFKLYLNDNTDMNFLNGIKNRSYECKDQESLEILAGALDSFLCKKSLDNELSGKYISFTEGELKFAFITGHQKGLNSVPEYLLDKEYNIVKDFIIGLKQKHEQFR